MEGIRPTEEYIIYCSKDSTKLLKLQDERSWSTLLDAAMVRCYVPILPSKGQNGDGIPDISHHRSCRSLFTIKRDLLKVQQQTSTAETSPTEFSNATRFTGQSLQFEVDEEKVCLALLPRSCIFCYKQKYQRNSRTSGKLTDCMEFRVNSTIKQAALARKDDKILAMAMSKDLISSDASTINRATEPTFEQITFSLLKKVIPKIMKKMITK